MPDRDYREEYDSFHGTAEQKKRRAARNKARRHLERDGRVSKGDGKDVDHKDHNPLNNSSSNIRVRDRSANRSDQ
ncbi:MAG: HNH endonuclease [Gammaproteobacteria bacterium]|nr:HNH endonuclease [Gammaproteobacteria bacterium]